MPAFSLRLVTSLTPEFQALGEELISAFLSERRCEFQRDFAEPYATGVICSLIGLSLDLSAYLGKLTIEMMGDTTRINVNDEDKTRVTFSLRNLWCEPA